MYYRTCNGYEKWDVVNRSRDDLSYAYIYYCWVDLPHSKQSVKASVHVSVPTSGKPGMGSVSPAMRW